MREDTALRSMLGRFFMLTILALIGACGPASDKEIIARWDETFKVLAGTTDIPLPPEAELVGDKVLRETNALRQVMYVVPGRNAQTVHDFYDVRTWRQGDWVIYNWSGAMKKFGWEQSYDNGDDMGFLKQGHTLTISFQAIDLSGGQSSLTAGHVTALGIDVGLLDATDQDMNRSRRTGTGTLLSFEFN